MLDYSGFKRRDYQEILNELIAQAQNTIAPDIATGADSVVGALLRVMAYELAKEEELQEAVWFNGFISQATGVSLDHLAANIGLYRSPAANATVKLTLTGIAGTKIKEQTLFGTSDNLNFFAGESGELIANGSYDTDGKTALGTLEILAVSVDQSLKANVAAGRIDQIVESVPGLRSVTNQRAATGGCALETDSSLRRRLSDNYRKSANGTVNSLITMVENVTGVQLVQVVVNNTMAADKYGNEPKSVHFYVQGGSEKEIAQAILDSVVAGVATVGKISVDVPLVSGTSSQTIRFDRPSEKVLDISVRLVTDHDFPLTGLSDVHDVVQEYMSGLKIGETLYLSKFVSMIYQVKGISDAEIKLSSSGAEISDSYVVPQQFEYLTSGKIEVSK